MSSNKRVGADLDALETILGDRLKTQRAAGPRAKIRSITAPGGPKLPGRRKPAMAAGFSLLALAALMMGVFAFVGLGGGGSAQAASVTPVVYEGNPTCTVGGPAGEGLGYDFGFKPTQPSQANPVGTHTIPGTTETVTITKSGESISWTSTIGIDAVIIKGGPNANVYVYDPPEESFGDADLHAPLNGDQPYGFSHMEFCIDFELDVEKTATTTFTRTYDWTIEKSVSPDEWDLFTGDSGTSEYEVTVTKGEGTDSNWAVSGTITIDNNTPFAATITSVTDSISGVGAVDVDCGVTFPHALAAGDDLICTYSSALPDGTDRVNTAEVSTSGAVGGGSATADVLFGEPTTKVNDTINVTDSVEGALGSTDETKTFTYTRTFTCDGDEGEHDNVATIVETGQSDDATVTVNCHALSVTKDADESFTRTWDWTIEKTADQSELLLSEGQSFEVNYEVTVSASSTDSAHAVTGGIDVHNPAPVDAVINAVSDVVSVGIAATVDCGVTYPYTLAAGETLECTYSAALPDASDRINTATATLQNHDYDEDGGAVPDGTTDFTGTAAVSFAGAPFSEVDECIDVSDDNAGIGSLGTVCASEAPKTFEYSLTFGTSEDNDVVLECGTSQHINIADFVTNDNGTTGDDDHTIDITVACEQLGGCTLTPGYWKTHNDSFRGGAPTDDTWELIPPSAEDSPFFLSTMTYFEVLWTPPQGNAYYNLSFHYIAAELNMLNGASVPANVQTAFDSATVLFDTYTPAQIAALKGKAGNELRAQFITLAGILGSYNEGAIGPGHCDEDSTSA